jgi:hypothetical protein
MPAGKELFGSNAAVTILLNSHFGAGKTHQGMTFEKVFAIGFDPSGLDILKQKALEELRQNLVWYEYVNPTNDDELRDAYRQTLKDGKKGLIYQLIDQVKEMAAKGEVKTILLDGTTYFADLRWRLINLDEVQKSERTGGVDTQAMYRNLGIWLQTFFSRDLLPLATRHGLNIICTCHLKREGEEQVQGSDKTGKAGKINKMSDIAPMIEGGFRNKIEGLFGASIYLERKLKVDGGVQYLAHCTLKQALSSVVEGKNRYGLPPTIDLTGKQLAKEIKPYLVNGAVAQEPVKAVVQNPVVTTQPAAPKAAAGTITNVPAKIEVS